MKLNKILLAILLIISSSFALEFKEVQLQSFNLQGFSKHITFENNKERNEQITKVWEKLFSSYTFYENSSDSKIYAVYSEQKKNSFKYFIGIKSNSKIPSYKKMEIKKSDFYKSSFIYTEGMNLDKLKIDDKNKIKRNKNLEFEVYKIDELENDSYLIELFIEKEK